jgi:hypothetical protein
MIAIIQRYNGENYVRLSINEDVHIVENITSEVAGLDCILRVHRPHYTTLVPLHGEGSGVLDAFHQGFKERLGGQYCFMERLGLQEFRVDTLSPRETGFGSADQVGVTILVQVENRERIAFRSNSFSLLSATLGCSLQMFEYFINGERTIKKLLFLLEDYRGRNRGDLQEKAMMDLAKLVSCSYYREPTA